MISCLLGTISSSLRPSLKSTPSTSIRPAGGHVSPGTSFPISAIFIIINFLTRSIFIISTSLRVHLLNKMHGTVDTAIDDKLNAYRCALQRDPKEMLMGIGSINSKMRPMTPKLGFKLTAYRCRRQAAPQRAIGLDAGDDSEVWRPNSIHGLP